MFKVLFVVYTRKNSVMLTLTGLCSEGINVDVTKMYICQLGYKNTYVLCNGPPQRGSQNTLKKYIDVFKTNSNYYQLM